MRNREVKTVVFWERWLRELPTIEAAANASSAKLLNLGRSGITHESAIYRRPRKYRRQHGGKFPENY